MRNEKELLAQMLQDAGIAFNIGLSSPTCLLVRGPDGRRWMVHEARTYDPQSNEEVVECSLSMQCDAADAMRIITGSKEEAAGLRKLANEMRKCILQPDCDACEHDNGTDSPCGLFLMYSSLVTEVS